MRINKTILWITQSALLITLLVGWQWASRSMFPTTTLVTGSGVNFILIVATMVCSLPTGLSVAAISPIMAAALGISPNWMVVPFMVAGNTVLVLVWNLIGKKSASRFPVLVSHIISLIAGAVLKFGVLYIGIVQIMVKSLEILPYPMAVQFSLPQLFTAAIGGSLAVIMIPVVRRIVPRLNGTPSTD